MGAVDPDCDVYVELVVDYVFCIMKTFFWGVGGWWVVLGFSFGLAVCWSDGVDAGYFLLCEAQGAEASVAGSLWSCV